MTFEQMPKERDRDGFARGLVVGEAASHFRMTQEIFRYARRTMQIRTERIRVYVSTDLQ